MRYCFFSPHFIDDTLNTRAECVRDSLICRKYMFLAKIFALRSMGIQLVPSPLRIGVYSIVSSPTIFCHDINTPVLYSGIERLWVVIFFIF